MKEIIDRQTFVFSVNMLDMTLDNKSGIITPINLRFAADELILKSLAYNDYSEDVNDMVQIWCSITTDGLITAFPNKTAILAYSDLHFRVNNNFQSGNIEFQFQETSKGAPFYYNPQGPIVNDGISNTTGILSFTIEFVKYAK